MKPSTDCTVNEELARLRAEYIKTRPSVLPPVSTSMKPFFISVVILILLLFIGWIANIVQVCQAAQDPMTTWLVLRIIGIFFFIPGAIFGWIGMI